MKFKMWNYNDQYLCHYGVKGMKWGHHKRQDEPIRGQKLSRLLKLEDKYKANGMSDNDARKEADRRIRKEQVVAGIAVAGVVLAAIGVYHLADSGDLNRLVTKGKAIISHTAPEWKIDKSLSDSNMSVGDIRDKVVSRINPDYGSPGTVQNCKRCTFAYELSRRGYNVTATKTMNATGQSAVGMYNATHDKTVKGGQAGYMLGLITDNKTAIDMASHSAGKKINLSSPLKGKAGSILEALSTEPNGARGELSVKWSAGMGHSMAWEIVQGKPVIFDCQSGAIYDRGSSLSILASRVNSASYTRLDNIDLNNDFLLKWVKNNDS